MTFNDLVREYGHIGLLYMQTTKMGILIEIFSYSDMERYFVSFGQDEEQAIYTASEVLKTWV